MSGYAVYGRAFRRAEWALREVFATQLEADRYAEAMVHKAEQSAPGYQVVRPETEAAVRPKGAPAGPPELGELGELGDSWLGEQFGGWIESAVVECESRSEVPRHLPAEWIVPVVSRYGHRALAEP